MLVLHDDNNNNSNSNDDHSNDHSNSDNNDDDNDDHNDNENDHNNNNTNKNNDNNNTSRGHVTLLFLLGNTSSNHCDVTVRFIILNSNCTLNQNRQQNIHYHSWETDQN